MPLQQLCSIPWFCSFLGEQHNLKVSAVEKHPQVLESGRYFTFSPGQFTFCSNKRSLSPSHLFTGRVLCAEDLQLLT